MQEQKGKKQNKSRNKGITLIALVITIIVLLILAAISIAMLTGENGLLTRANDAKKVTEQAGAKEKVQMEVAGSFDNSGKFSMDNLKNNLKKNLGLTDSDIENHADGSITVTVDGFKVTVDKLGNVTVGESTGGVTPPSPTEKPGKPNAEGIFTENSTINGGTGSYNNPEIPKGFKPVDEGSAVWGEGTSAPTQEAVNAGLIIEDDLGNQFVWIPVDGGLYNGTLDTTKVQLGRYSFDRTTGVHSPYSGSSTEDTSETHNTNLKNTIAKDIEGFKTSVANHGGYYIARYEASKGKNDKPASRVSKETPATSSSTPIEEGMLWNYITQLEAATACRNMYDSNYGVTSDLMNSYAWDTAIVFIQKNSENPDYSVDKSGNIGTNALKNTGETGDVVCNIYDMSGNVQERTTENPNDVDYPCISRGGRYDTNYWCATSRAMDIATDRYSYMAFRPLLYL